MTLAVLVAGVGVSGAGCGGSDEATEARIARERAEAARAARQDERIAQLRRDLAAQRRRTPTAPAAPAPPPTVLPSAAPRRSGAGGSAFAGSWVGEATQYTPRGTSQVVTLRTTIDADGQIGSHREYIVGAGQDSDCRGTLTRRGYGLYGYREGASSRCIATTSIRLTRVGGSLRFSETYSTSAGVGRVVGALRRP